MNSTIRKNTFYQALYNFFSVLVILGGIIGFSLVFLPQFLNIPKVEAATSCEVPDDDYVTHSDTRWVRAGCDYVEYEISSKCLENGTLDERRREISRRINHFCGGSSSTVNTAEPTSVPPGCCRSNSECPDRQSCSISNGACRAVGGFSCDQNSGINPTPARTERTDECREDSECQENRGQEYVCRSNQCFRRDVVSGGSGATGAQPASNHTDGKCTAAELAECQNTGWKYCDYAGNRPICSRPLECLDDFECREKRGVGYVCRNDQCVNASTGTGAGASGEGRVGHESPQPSTTPGSGSVGADIPPYTPNICNSIPGADLCPCEGNPTVCISGYTCKNSGGTDRQMRCLRANIQDVANAAVSAAASAVSCAYCKDNYRACVANVMAASTVENIGQIANPLNYTGGICLPLPSDARREVSDPNRFSFYLGSFCISQSNSDRARYDAAQLCDVPYASCKARNGCQ